MTSSGQGERGFAMNNAALRAMAARPAKTPGHQTTGLHALGPLESGDMNPIEPAEDPATPRASDTVRPPTGRTADRGTMKRPSGIFTALFGASPTGERIDLDAVELGPPGSGSDSVRTATDPAAASDNADLIIGWKDRVTGGRIQKISDTSVTLVTTGDVPLYYERVCLTPAHRSRREAELIMFGTVSRVRDPQVTGSRAFTVRFTKVDERGNTGVFHEFLRYYSRG